MKNTTQKQIKELRKSLSYDIGGSTIDLVNDLVRLEVKQAQEKIKDNLEKMENEYLGDVINELEKNGIKAEDLSNDEVKTEINNLDVYEWQDYYIGYYNAISEIKGIIR